MGVSIPNIRVKRCVVAGAAVAIGVLVVFVWLTLWADERNQRFYMVNEPRNWVG